MTKDEFHKEMQELAEDKFEWSEISDDYYMLYLENDYVAIELVDDGTFAVECEWEYEGKPMNWILFDDDEVFAEASEAIANYLGWVSSQLTQDLVEIMKADK